MTLHVLGFARAADGHPDGIIAGDLAVLVSPAALDGAALLARLEGASALGPVLPARRNATLADVDAARALLTERGPAIGAALARIDGCAELVAALRLDEPPPANGASGAGYLHSAAARARTLRDNAEAAKGWVRTALAAAPVRAMRFAPWAGGFDACILAPHAAIEAVRQALAEAGDPPRAACRLAGPFPPFSFAAASDKDAP